MTNELIDLPAKNIFQLDGHGRARREAARRHKSECKINFRKKKFLSQQCQPEVINSNKLNFRPNFKFSRLIFFWGGGTPPHLGCALTSLGKSSVCKNLRAQHPLSAEM